MIMVFSKPKDKENAVPISNDDDDEDFYICFSLLKLEANIEQEFWAGQADHKFQQLTSIDDAENVANVS